MIIYLDNILIFIQILGEYYRVIYKCYNLRLGSGCNLDKDLSWEVGKNQLVKCKDTGLYLQLYISINLKVNIQYTCVYDITENEKIISTT